MTVPDQTPYNRYTANGATTVFAYTFRIEDEEDLGVYINDVATTTGYTVSGVGENSGGSITFSTPPNDQSEVFLIRQMPYTREEEYQNSGPFRAETVNHDFDRLWLAIQQINGNFEGQVLVRKNPVDPVLNILPNPQQDYGLVWGPNGEIVNKIVNDTVIIGNGEATDSTAGIKFNTLSDMKNGTAAGGRNLSYENIIGSPTSDNVVRASTLVNNTTTKGGGSDYDLKTANQATLDGDVIDGVRNHYLEGGTVYVAVLVYDGLSIDGLACGLVDDDATNNKTAIDVLLSLAPINIVLKNQVSGSYLYDGAMPFNDLTGVVYELEEGVVIRKASSGSNPMWIRGARVNRAVKNPFTPGNYDQYSSPISYRPIAEIPLPVKSDIDSSQVPYVLDGTADFHHYQITAWPNGGATPATPPGTINRTLINWGTILASGFSCSAAYVAPGDQIQANVISSGREGVFVKTVGGWCVCQAAFGSNSVEIRIKEGGGNSTSYNFEDEIIGQSQYGFSNSWFGCRIHSANEFSIVINGVAVKRVKLPSAITGAGWCVGFGSGTGIFENMTTFKNKKSVGIKPLRICAVGDSTTDTALPPSQMQFCKQYLGGAHGCQVETLTNIAVAGQTSAQQLAVLQSTDISNYDFCCIQIGVNDIQTGVHTATYISNINAMIDYCEASNVVPIIGVPTMYYSQAQAQLYGRDGQNTGNSDNGTKYRDLLTVNCADRGVALNYGSIQDMGGVLAYLIQFGEDAIMMDNIHPTVLGQMMMGFSFAKSIIQHFSSNTRSDELQRLPSSIFNFGIGATVQPLYSFHENTIDFDWYFSRDGITINNDDVVMVLPPRFRPKTQVTVPAVCTSATSYIPTASPNAQLSILDNGEVRAYNIDNTCNFISFNASYELKG